ncbi:MAG: type II toxin-antitoxin system YafQ family toxin [Bauldia sp.]
MRRIEETAGFRRDLRRTKSRSDRRLVAALLADVISDLRNDVPLPARHADHNLSGRWAGFRDCHVRPDLVLIYRKYDEVLQLVRLNTHSELFRK